VLEPPLPPTQRGHLAPLCRARCAAAATAAVRTRAESLPQSAQGPALWPPLARVRPQEAPRAGGARVAVTGSGRQIGQPGDW